jgi:hypothetical protein
VHGTGDTLYSKILHYASGALGAVGTLVLNHPVATVFIATATAGIVAGLAAYMCKHRSNGGDQAAVTRVDGDQNVNENDTHDTSNVTNAKASRDGEPYTI